MTRNQAKFYVLCALVMLVSGLGIVTTGHPSGWVLAVLGAVNTTLGLLNLRKSKRPLS
ncbi:MULTISPECIES: hypothetical protein [unclassified Frondihabitans]|uniref:hypothetical protein n=1 Tax=unclassified Frondihabitans TaxID=2626248 RepID=UPI0013152CBD|nr:MULTISPECIES: hypothetical protein [unclassified Frondihabitans]MBF4575450.1 hypothetical protein [Frondihabitans sp. VKM Ac-2883]